MGKQYKAGIIAHTGKGNYGHGLHLSYQGLPGVEVVAVADPDAEGRKKGMAECGAQRGYEDYKEMLAKEELDVVSVCPRYLTYKEEMVIAAAEAGCHIYSEKPLARYPASADRMLEACEKNGVKIAVAHQLHHFEPFRTVKKMIDKGEIGRLISIHSRGKEDRRGGGEDMLVLGTHLFDMVQYIAGKPEWVFGHVTVDGRDMTIADARDADEPVGPIAGDAVTAVFGFPGDLHAFYRSEKGRADQESRYGITFVGSEGVISIAFGGTYSAGLSRQELILQKGGTYEPLDISMEPDVPGAEPLEDTGLQRWGNRRAVWDLLKSAEENREPETSGDKGRTALEMIMGVHWSHLKKRRIEFPLEDRSHPLEP